MKNKLIADFEAKHFPNESKKVVATNFRPGDTVRVMYKIQEGADKSKFRLQAFEGVVIRKKKGGVAGSFTVRKIGANGVGVERVFPLVTPNIDSIDVIASGIVRRSRLYYLRELSGKAARIRSRFGGRKSAVVVPGADQEVEVPVADQSVNVDEPAAPAAEAAAPAADAPKEDK